MPMGSEGRNTGFRLSFVAPNIVNTKQAVISSSKTTPFQGLSSG